MHAPSPPTRAQLLDRVEALAPAIAARAAAADTERRLSAETIADLRASGLFRIMQARNFGGYELPMAVLFEVEAALAKHCGSTAWIVGLGALQVWMLGYYPEAVQREVFGAGGDILTAQVAGPTMTAERVTGGYRL